LLTYFSEMKIVLVKNVVVRLPQDKLAAVSEVIHTCITLLKAWSTEVAVHATMISELLLSLTFLSA